MVPLNLSFSFTKNKKKKKKGCKIKKIQEDKRLGWQEQVVEWSICINERWSAPNCTIEGLNWIIDFFTNLIVPLNDINVKGSANWSSTKKNRWICIKIKFEDLIIFLIGWFELIIYTIKGLIKFIN